MLRKLFKWFLALFRKKKCYEKNNLYKYIFIEDVPHHAEDRTLYFIGEQNYYWQFVMVCPCGCKSLLHMNLMSDEAPYWTYIIRNDLVSITPSIDRIVGCRSHFFIKEGKIIWA